MGSRRQHGYTSGVWFAAALVHLGVFGLWQGSDDVTAAPSEVAAFQSGESLAPLDLSSVALISLPSPGGMYSEADLVAMIGASDQSGAAQREALQNSVNAPGALPGQRAAGEGGAESFAARQDESTRSASTWNSRSPTLMPHTGAAPRGNTSSESLQRAEKRSYSDEERRRHKAHAGSEQSLVGSAWTEGQGGAPGTAGNEWLAADPRFDVAPREQRKFVSGAVALSSESARMDQGKASTEHAKDGRVTESQRAPDRSNRAEQSPFHLGAPSAGRGEGTGAKGTRGKSNAGNEASGSAAQSGQGQGTALASTRASRSHPYFNEMYRRIDKELRFPRKLALALEQGDLVLSFQLDKRGRIRSLAVKKGSGFPDFDTEAVRAFRAASPFGVVPAALLGTRDRVAVLAPYYFRNPLIR